MSPPADRPETRSLDPAAVSRVRALLEAAGLPLKTNPKNRYIAFEGRTAGKSIFTVYTSGKLVSTVREGDPVGRSVAAGLTDLLGDAAASRAGSGGGSGGRGAGSKSAGGAPGRGTRGGLRWLAGADETGTGELLGSAVLAGALLPVGLAGPADAIAGHVETKASRSMAGWDRLGQGLAALREQGLVLAVRPLSNRLFDRWRKNALLDLGYVRLFGDLLAGAAAADIGLDDVLHEAPPADTLELAIDDYGAGALLTRAATRWREAGLSVLVTTKADRDHLAARVASVAARAARAREMGGLQSESTDGRLGTGNAGDRQTLGWLRHRKRLGKPWPSFVKASFKTVYELDGKVEHVKEAVPELRELFDARSADAFLAGRLDVRTAKLVGPTGRGVRKLTATPEGVRRAPKADFPAWDLAPLLFGGAVLDEALLDADALDVLDRLLDRETGLLSGWRLLVGPTLSAGDPAHVTLLRAHNAGVVELVPTPHADPTERAVAFAGLLLTPAAKSPVLAVRLVD